MGTSYFFVKVTGKVTSYFFIVTSKALCPPSGLLCRSQASRPARAAGVQLSGGRKKGARHGEDSSGRRAKITLKAAKEAGRLL